MKFYQICLLGIILLMAGCAAQPRPTEMTRGRMISSNTLRVRTTAYTGKRNALNACLMHGDVCSAAADWSRFPLGTEFRIRENGQKYLIDDYGSALVGTRTIDLCMPSNRAMHAWGVRYVEIEVTKWGSPRQSMEVLTPRAGTRYVRRMLISLKAQNRGIPEKFHRVKM
jgi:3D (Asp-Asp-Asp) domain-containing protein